MTIRAATKQSPLKKPKLSTISNNFSTKIRKIKIFHFFQNFWYSKNLLPLIYSTGTTRNAPNWYRYKYFLRCPQGWQSRPKKLVDIFCFDQNFGRLFSVSTNVDQKYWSTFLGVDQPLRGRFPKCSGGHFKTSYCSITAKQRFVTQVYCKIYPMEQISGSAIKNW
jgi:hypothetical protein